MSLVLSTHTISNADVYISCRPTLLTLLHTPSAHSHLCRTQLISDMRSYNQEAKSQARLLPLPMDTIYGHSKQLWDEAKAAMGRGAFEPRLDPVTRHCQKELSWWA